MQAVHILVEGLVQGVWYRASTRREALRLNLKGWVRNLPDGRVEILAQGSPAAVDELCRWCQTGPPGAEVTHVLATPAPIETNLENFELRY